MSFVRRGEIDSLKREIEKLKKKNYPGGGSGGDMLKSVYDQDDDGVVDNSEALDGHTADEFALANHNHAFTDLADTPSSYTDSVRLPLRVNLTADGLEFMKAAYLGQVNGFLADEPDTPIQTGDSYVIGESPTYTPWLGHQGEYTIYDGTTWKFIYPEVGMLISFLEGTWRVFYICYSTSGLYPAWSIIPTYAAPLSHASSHQRGGSDVIKLDDLETPDDNTDLNATTTRHGLLPKLSGSISQFLRGDGNWATPPGGGGSAVTAWAIVSKNYTCSEAESYATTQPTGALKTFIVPAGATGNWSGHDDEMAVWNESTSNWDFYAPEHGWIALELFYDSSVSFGSFIWFYTNANGWLAFDILPSGLTYWNYDNTVSYQDPLIQIPGKHPTSDIDYLIGGEYGGGDTERLYPSLDKILGKVSVDAVYTEGSLPNISTDNYAVLITSGSDWDVVNNIIIRDSELDIYDNGSGQRIYLDTYGNYWHIVPTNVGDIVYNKADSKYYYRYRNSSSLNSDWRELAGNEFASITHNHDSDYAPISKGVTNGDSHDHAGGDGASITENALSLSDVTTDDVSTSKHGFCPKLPNDNSKFLNGVGAWAVPSGGGGSAIMVGHTSFNPADSQTYYFGMGIYNVPSSDSSSFGIRAPRAGTVKYINLINTVGTTGSDEDVTIKIRKNGGAASTVGTVKWNSAVFSLYEDIDFSVSKDDYIELIYETPEFATNPQNVTAIGFLYIE